MDNKKPAQIYQVDFYGTRESKFEKLNKENIETIRWNKLPENTELWRVEGEGKSEYLKGFSLTDLFQTHGLGVVTARDGFVIDTNKDVLYKRMLDFIQLSIEEARLKYNLRKDVQAWRVSWAQEDIKETGADADNIQNICYRPFDNRYIYYTKKSSGILARPSFEIMQHFFRKENLGLLIKRQGKQDFSYAFVVNSIAESCMFESAYANITVCPLYLYHDRDIKSLNFKTEISEEIERIVGKVSPEDIFDYIYALLHSPSYREKYKEFLKIDFPRVPYPKDRNQFEKLVVLGRELRGIHLLESPKVNQFITTYPIAGLDTIEKLAYKDGKIFINKDQYFGNVPELAWNFYIGGYQPAQKWLKDRKGRTLTNSDIEHYQKIIVALVETGRIMKEIDNVLGKA